MNRARSTLAALALTVTIAGASVAAVAATVTLIDVRSAVPSPSPDVLSFRIAYEDEAHDMWREALTHGESVCLTELNDGGPRYWLHSCAQPRFANQVPCEDGPCYVYSTPLAMAQGQIARIEGDAGQ